jgi:hypothetical protein
MLVIPRGGYMGPEKQQSTDGAGFEKQVWELFDPGEEEGGADDSDEKDEEDEGDQ